MLREHRLMKYKLKVEVGRPTHKIKYITNLNYTLWFWDYWKKKYKIQVLATINNHNTNKLGLFTTTHPENFRGFKSFEFNNNKVMKTDNEYGIVLKIIGLLHVKETSSKVSSRTRDAHMDILLYPIQFFCLWRASKMEDQTKIHCDEFDRD